jgi:hypothetical protein
MQTNKEAFLEFIRGVGLTFVVLGVFFAFILTLGDREENPPEKYKVVDHYGTCAVVRYTDDSNRWHYFLDCREVR